MVMTNYISAMNDEVFNAFDSLLSPNMRFKPFNGKTFEASYSNGTVEEKSDFYEYRFNIAGASKDNIKLTIEEKNIVLRVDQEELNYYNSFPLPEKADLSKTEATYKDGILTFKVFKLEKLKPLNIDIK